MMNRVCVCLASLLAPASLGSPCPTDVSGDGTTDINDLIQMLGDWGNAGEGDFDGDGAVDSDDIGLLIASWGPCGGAARWRRYASGGGR